MTEDRWQRADDRGQRHLNSEGGMRKSELGRDTGMRKDDRSERAEGRFQVSGVLPEADQRRR
jgi:hypothetical protein